MISPNHYMQAIGLLLDEVQDVYFTIEILWANSLKKNFLKLGIH